RPCLRGRVRRKIWGGWASFTRKRSSVRVWYRPPLSPSRRGFRLTHRDDVRERREALGEKRRVAPRYRFVGQLAYRQTHLTLDRLGHRGLHDSERGERRLTQLDGDLRRHVRHVEVEHGAPRLRDQGRQHPLDDGRRGRLVVRIRFAPHVERDREPARVVHAGRQRGAHGAGVQDDAAQVRAAVDTRQHEIRRLAEGAVGGEQRDEPGGGTHAVGGYALHLREFASLDADGG